MSNKKIGEERKDLKVDSLIKITILNFKLSFFILIFTFLIICVVCWGEGFSKLWITLWKVAQHRFCDVVPGGTTLQNPHFPIVRSERWKMHFAAWCFLFSFVLFKLILSLLHLHITNFEYLFFKCSVFLLCIPQFAHLRVWIPAFAGMTAKRPIIRPC